MGPPDLIGRVELDVNAILAMVRTVPPTGNGLNYVHGRAMATSIAVAPAAVTWLELEPEVVNGKAPTDASQGRNPFDSLGDISVALTARLALPVSLEEYGRSREETEGVGGARGVVDAGVRVSSMYTPEWQKKCVGRVGRRYLTILYWRVWLQERSDYILGALLELQQWYRVSLPRCPSDCVIESHACLVSDV